MLSNVEDIAVRRGAAADEFTLRRPQAEDGRSVNALIAACPPLDRNSLYLNLLQCTHFAETCVLAEFTDDSSRPGGRSQPAGFISGYLTPARPTTLFIWQVAVSERARGRGLGKCMLLALLQRPACQHVTHIETTVTPSNAVSWAMFNSLARELECRLERRVLFERDTHLDGVHESEVLATIGPFAPRAASFAAKHRRTL
ncbi:MAG TPA: diaminobutyrate acetyltransferase [Steroidobacter sp.]|jgi:L-2,4-diaminobutyric acid acetyltransferase|nr:diaminobutyrate acetyltransferase [Steroidobacteraceae bacterium]HLS82226.1 diaminobutyrate acetyltransferase [Steroidobacter sp.]